MNNGFGVLELPVFEITGQNFHRADLEGTLKQTFIK